MQKQQVSRNGLLLGAIIGDIWGSIYEFNNRKTINPTEIPLPTCKHLTKSSNISTSVFWRNL